jgi:hypothetical protein
MTEYEGQFAGQIFEALSVGLRGSMPSCTSCGGCFGALCLDLSRGEVRHDL